MPRFTVCPLPAGCRWRPTPCGRELVLDTMPLAEVRRQNAGWIVELGVAVGDGQPIQMAVRNEERGMRWAEQWTRERASMLVALARQHRLEAEALEKARRESAAASAECAAFRPVMAASL